MRLWHNCLNTLCVTYAQRLLLGELCHAVGRTDRLSLFVGARLCFDEPHFVISKREIERNLEKTTSGRASRSSRVPSRLYEEPETRSVDAWKEVV